MKDDSLFFNKIAAAVLTAGLLAMVVGLISSTLYHTEAPEEDAYVIADVSEEGGAQQAAASSEPQGPGDIKPMLADADPATGEKVAKACVSCHSFEQGGPNKVGPNLYNVVGSDIASIDGFNYSSAMADTEGAWTYEALNQFLYDPKGFVNGTKMAFRGVKKDQKRAALVSYLRSLSDNPEPLPE